MTVFSWDWLLEGVLQPGTQCWLFLALPRAGVLPRAPPAQRGNHSFTKDYCSELRAYSWEQKRIVSVFWGYYIFHSRWKTEKKKKIAYVNREMKDIAGASSQPKMRTLSAFINIGGFVLNMMFPSKMGFFLTSYFPLTIHWQPLFVLFRINVEFF